LDQDDILIGSVDEQRLKFNREFWKSQDFLDEMKDILPVLNSFLFF